MSLYAPGVDQQTCQISDGNFATRNKVAAWICWFSGRLKSSLGTFNSPYPNRHNIVRLPVKPDPPKKIPDAMASFFASWKTLSTLCENLDPSSVCALNAATVLNAFSFSSAV